MSSENESIQWESRVRSGYRERLAFRKCLLHDNAIFKLFLKIIKNVAEDAGVSFSLDDQRFLAACSSMTGDETRVIDWENLEEYDYPRAVTIPLQIPKEKNGRIIRFLFVYHQFLDDGQDKCAMYALGFLYLREPLLQKLSNVATDARTTRIEVQHLRPMQEWAKWVGVLRSIQDFETRTSREPLQEEEHDFLKKEGLTAEIPLPSSSAKGGFLHISCNKPVAGCVGLEEILQRVQARLHFYDRCNDRKLRSFEERKYAAAFPATTRRGRAVDFVAKYLLCAAMQGCIDLFYSSELSIFQMRLDRELTGAHEREVCLEENGLAKGYLQHAASCDHDKTDCFQKYIACEHFRGLKEMTRHVQATLMHPVADEIEEVSFDEGGRGSTPSNKRGKMRVQEGVFKVAEAVKNWMMENPYI